MYEIIWLVTYYLGSWRFRADLEFRSPWQCSEAGRVSVKSLEETAVLDRVMLGAMLPGDWVAWCDWRRPMQTSKRVHPFLSVSCCTWRSASNSYRAA